MLAVAVVSATPRSPFFAVLPEGYEPSGPLRWLADLLQLQRLNDTGLVIVGLIATSAAAIGFLLVAREAWNGRITMRTVIVLAVVYNVTVVALPLLFSRDVYSYAYYGRIITTYGSNPYVLAPKDFPINSLFHLTWPGWRGTPSVYGPLFTWISAILTVVAKSLPSVITSFQMVTAAASLGTVAIVARLVKRVRPARAVFAAAMIGLNPIVVFHVVGGGHNDMLVAFFIAAALALVFNQRYLWSAVTLALGMSVKATAVIPLVLLIVMVVADTEPGRRRRVLMTYVGVSGGVWLALAIPFLQSINPTLGLMEVAGHDSWLAPGQILVHLFSGIGRLIGGEPFAEHAQVLARITLLATSTGAVLWIARKLWTKPEWRTPTALAAAWGWALLAVILPAPILFTWYLMWILPLVWVLPKIPRRSMVLLSVFFVVTQLVTESQRLPDGLRSVHLTFGHPVAIAVCIWVGITLYRRLRDDVPFEAETSQPTLGDRFEAGPAMPIERSAVVTLPPATNPVPDRTSSDGHARPRPRTGAPRSAR
jgi:alpha-1,6-mannosyltransferase